MSLSESAYLNAHSSSAAVSLAWAAENCSAPLNSELLSDFSDVAESRNRSMVDYSVAGNRLQERAGYIELVPKTPGEIFGEQVLRPLFDAAYNSSIYTLSVLKNGFQRLDSIFARALRFPPGAGAASQLVVLPGQSFQRESSSKTPCDEESLCGSGKDLEGAEKEHQSFEARPSALPTPSPKLLISRTSCPMENYIDFIGDVEQLIISPNRKALRRTFEQLNYAACKRKLANCHQNLMELVYAIDANSLDYPVGTLRPLPEFLALVVQVGKEIYNHENFVILTMRINELSQNMLELGGQVDISNIWIDVLLHSIKHLKNPSGITSNGNPAKNGLLAEGFTEEPRILIVSGIKTAIKALNRQTGASLNQRGLICEIAKILEMDAIFQEEQIDMETFRRLGMCDNPINKIVIFAGGCILFIAGAGLVTYYFCQANRATTISRNQTPGTILQNGEDGPKAMAIYETEENSDMSDSMRPLSMTVLRSGRKIFKTSAVHRTKRRSDMSGIYRRQPQMIRYSSSSASNSFTNYTTTPPLEEDSETTEEYSPSESSSGPEAFASESDA